MPFAGLPQSPWPSLWALRTSSSPSPVPATPAAAEATPATASAPSWSPHGWWVNHGEATNMGHRSWDIIW